MVHAVSAVSGFFVWAGKGPGYVYVPAEFTWCSDSIYVAVCAEIKGYSIAYFDRIAAFEALHR